MSFTLVGAVGPLCNSFWPLWPCLPCGLGASGLRSGPFRVAKRPFSYPETACSAGPDGPYCGCVRRQGWCRRSVCKKIISASSRHRAGWLTGPAVAFQCLAPMPTACRRGRPRGQSGCKIIQFWPKRKMCQALFSCRLAMAAVADGAYIHYIYVSLAGGYSRAGFRKRGVACAVCCQWRHGRGSTDVMALPADM